MNKSFNLYGSIEVEKNICKYRIELSKAPNLLSEKAAEEELKSGLFAWGDNQQMVVAPMSVKFLNHFLVIYYNLKGHYPLSMLKEVPLEEKLQYFFSVIELFRNLEKIPFTTERLNFVVDPSVEQVKILFFETQNLEVYEKDNEPVKTLRDILASSFTIQDNFIALPKRVDFIEPSSVNIKFVETLFKLDTIDDIYFLVEKTKLEIEMDNLNEKENEDETISVKGKKKKLKNKKPKVEKAVPQKYGAQGRNKPQDKKRFDKKMLVLLALVPIFLVTYFGFNLYIKASNTQEIDANQDISENFLKNEFEDVLLKSYQAVYNNNIEEAYKLLSQLNTTTVDDINLLIEVYYRSNKSSELLDKYPNVANNFINYLVANDLIFSVSDLTSGMKTVNPYIEFEKAVAKSNYEKVLALKPEVEMNARREQQVLTAYIGLGKTQEAMEFANQTKNPDLIKQAANSLK